MQTVLQITVVRVDAALAPLPYEAKQKLASIAVLLASVCPVANLPAQNMTIFLLLSLHC